MRILLLILSSFSLQVRANKTLDASKPSENPSCKLLPTYKFLREHGSFSGDNICLGETYRYGHQIDTFREECSIEPSNEFLSYGDSVWTFYKCIAQKSLGDLPLTLTNYAKMMAGNLSATTQSAIMSVLNTKENESESKVTEITTEESVSNYTEVDDIKKYWRNYFDAEYQVCTNSVNNNCTKERRRLKLNELRHYYEPIQDCQDGRVPDYRNRQKFTRRLFREKVESCIVSLNQSHPDANLTTVHSHYMHEVCTKVVKGLIDIGDSNFNTLVDFESLYNKIISPNYYSKLVKENIFKLVRAGFSIGGFLSEQEFKKSETIKDVFSFAVQNTETMVKAYEPRSENRTFLINLRILNALFDYESSAMLDLCVYFNRKRWDDFQQTTKKPRNP